MYHHNYPFRRPVLSYPDPHHSHMYVPMTPMDPMYSQSMLPANLLATPSPYVSHPSFLGSAHVGNSSPYFTQMPFSAGNGPDSRPLSRTHSSPKLMSYASPQQLQQQHTSLEHLNFSRTVVLSGLAPSLSLREILDAVDHGPLENAQLIQEKENGDKVESQTCVLAFVNTHISYHFHLKYAKNVENLDLLKEQLHNSTDLRIGTETETGAADTVPDVIKVKTLNYIMEYNATRALGVSFQILDSDLVPLMEKSFRARIAKYGAWEDLVVTEHEDEDEGENASQLQFVVHFTCIDTAIAVHEYYTAHMAGEDIRDDLVQLVCVDVSFQQDRCDRTSLVHARKPSMQAPPLAASSECASSVSSSSPVSSATQKPSPESSSSHASALQLNFKGMDPVHDTRATSEQSHDIGKASRSSPLIDPMDGLGAAGFASDESGPASPSIDPHDYLPSHGFASSIYSSEPVLVSPASHASSFSADPLGAGNRTIYLGNLHPKTTIEEITNNVRAGGLVERILHYRTRCVCFITFVDPAIALKFFLSHQVMHQLIIRDRDVSVSWGKVHSGPLPFEISNAVASGASRNVYIGLRVQDAGSSGLQVPDANTLRRDFSHFGSLEQINLIPKKNCGFMNFLNIADAIRLVDCFETRDVNQIRQIVGDDGQFYEKYRHFKISYGKDRCGNPLRFSYVKNDQHSKRSRRANILPEKIDPIDEESANVFGISTNNSNELNEEVISDNYGESTIEQARSQRLDQESGGESDSDFDEDDDISIIINPETTDTSVTESPRKPKRNNIKRVYHSDVALAELLDASLHLNSDSSYVSYNQSFDQSSRRSSVASQSSFHRMQFPPVQYPRTFSRGPAPMFPPIPPFPMPYGVPVHHHSGSQVMADYLARGQSENLLYAKAMLSGDFHPDGMRNPRRQGRKSFRK